MSGYFGNMFSGVGGTMPGQGGNHFNPGFHGLVVVDTIKVQQSHRGGHTNVIVELRVLESNQPEKPTGSAASWVLNTTHQPWKGNYTWLLAACLGIPISNEAEVKRQVTDQVAEYAVTPANPMRGKVVRLQTENITTQGKKQPFTKHSWYPVEQTQYAAAAGALLQSAPVANAAQSIPSAPQQPPPGFNLPPQGAPQPQQPMQPPPGFAMPQSQSQSQPQPQPQPGFSPPPGFAMPQPQPQQQSQGFSPPPGFSQPQPQTQQPPPGFNAPPAFAPPAAAVPAPPSAPSDWVPNHNDPTGQWEWSPSTGKQRNKVTGAVQ